GVDTAGKAKRCGEARIVAELAKLGPVKPNIKSASVRAVGTGYLPGLFRIAFVVEFDLDDSDDPAMACASGLNPFQLLSASRVGLRIARDHRLSSRTRRGRTTPRA